ncbi:MAG: pilus assembly protein TadG-related protein [Vicinamibacterales bacterium]
MDVSAAELVRRPPRFCDVRRNETGQILLMSALMLPVLLGFTALAIDSGYAFEARKRVQAAADAGALAGAHAIDHDPSVSTATITAIVRADAGGNGFVDGVDGVTVTVIKSPSTTDGFTFDWSLDPTAVGVIITQPKSTFFTQVISSMTSMTLRGQAVASSGEDSDTNIVILATGGPGSNCSPSTGDALFDVGGGTIQVGGSVYVNSTNPTCAAYTQGVSASVTAGSGVFVVGGADQSGGPISPLFTGVAPIDDPFEDLVEPSAPAVVDDGTPALQGCTGGVCVPGTYLVGLKPNNQTLLPGLYYAYSDGSVQEVAVDFQGTVTGTGVTIFIKTGGWRTKNAGDSVNLSAPTNTALPSSPGAAEAIYGVVIFQARDNPIDAEVWANSTVSFTGAVYMHNLGCADPHLNCAMLRFFANAGQPTGSPYSIYVVDALELHGGGLVINNDFSGAPGGSPLSRVSLGE